tara:strand:- start:2982 stop:3128 length:147 start_codon:yes stop_codon:yes gene_type:complete
LIQGALDDNFKTFRMLSANNETDDKKKMYMQASSSKEAATSMLFRLTE